MLHTFIHGRDISNMKEPECDMYHIFVTHQQIDQQISSEVISISTYKPFYYTPYSCVGLAHTFSVLLILFKQ